MCLVTKTYITITLFQDLHWTEDQGLGACESNPCQHDGKCVPFGTDTKWKYYCECPTGFTGYNCECEYGLLVRKLIVLKAIADGVHAPAIVRT